MNLRSSQWGEADQSFVFFVFLFHFYSKKSFFYTPQGNDQEDSREGSVFCFLFFFPLVTYLCPVSWMNCRLPTTLFKNHNCSWTELLAINIVSIYILILAVCLIFHNKVYKNYCLFMVFFIHKPCTCLHHVCWCLSIGCSKVLFSLSSVNDFVIRSKKILLSDQVIYQLACLNVWCIICVVFNINVFYLGCLPVLTPDCVIYQIVFLPMLISVLCGWVFTAQVWISN